MKQKNLVIEIENDGDACVSLQISPTTIHSKDGVSSGEPEAVLLLSDNINDAHCVSLFTSSQLGDFINKLEQVKWLLDNWQPKK